MTSKKCSGLTCEIFQKLDRTVNLSAKAFQVRANRPDFCLIFSILKKKNYLMEPLIEPGFRVDLTEYFKEFGKLKEPALSLKVASIETQILAKWGWPPNNWTEKDEVSVLPAVFKIMWSIYVSAEAIEILATAKRFINEALQNLVGRAALLYLESKQQSKVWGDLIN